jgi:hypothetical protein
MGDCIMKISRSLILLCFAVAVVALVWQARRIFELRKDVASLRNDLRIVLARPQDDAAGLSPEAAQARRDQLELIRLRNEVRDLKESIADSHAGTGKTGLRAALHDLFPPHAATGPWKLRPEWKGYEKLAATNYAQAMKALAGATNEYARFLSLGPAAKMSLAVGHTEDARQFATDMMVLDDKYSRGAPEKANGDVVFNGNLVLGTIALDEGQLDEAKRRLLAAGRSAGSPMLGSFGPNMSLARELLEKGEQETVLQFLELCRKFWTYPAYSGKLDVWIKDIHKGRIPDFGANLIY